MIAWSGHAGSLQVGYQEAAALGAWRIEVREPGRYLVEASVVRQSAYWLTQRPQDLRLHVPGTGWLRWDGVAVVADDGMVVGELIGAPAVER